MKMGRIMQFKWASMKINQTWIVITNENEKDNEVSQT